MMKLSFTTLGCPEWSFAKILDEAQKMGYSGIEIRGIEDKMLAEEIVQFFPENRQAALDALKARGLEMVGFGSSVRFDPADKFDAMLAEGKRAVDVCQFMGIPLVRIFGNNFPAGESESAVIERVARGAGLLAEYGEDKGVMVLLETHGDFNTVERVKGVFDQVKSKNFNLLWDVAHTDFTYADDFMKFYSVMKDRIVHTHFKDHIRGNPADEKTYKLCQIGEGNIPIKAIVKRLLADGYKGYFSLEWEKKWHPDLPPAEIAYPEFIRVMNDAQK
ncbi:MAG: sugar phosphate isomerase/epimerase [Treponema sp.]|jgi:sugar phosphate isomerase/epimerase|nr:sugar phosphate isomerase/epimerase [Treponema sp.]